MDDAAARQCIDRSPLGAHRGALAAHLAPAIRIVATPLAPRRADPADMRFGGTPGLPGSWSWPVAATPHRSWWQRCLDPLTGGDRRPLDFVAQLDLAALAQHGLPAPWPTTGWLYFFYDCGRQPAGDTAHDAGQWQVRWFDGPQRQLAPTRRPDAFEPFHLCRIETSTITTLPTHWPLPGAVPHGYAPLLQEILPRSPLHQIGGHPQNLQAAMPAACAAHVAHPAGEADDDTAPSWTLLLQVDTDPAPGWTWQDQGMLYFWIRNTDLAARRFERTWCMLQCC